MSHKEVDSSKLMADRETGVDWTLRTIHKYKPAVEPFVTYPLWVVFVVGYLRAIADTDPTTIGIGVVLLFPLIEAFWAGLELGVRRGSLLVILIDAALAGLVLSGLSIQQVMQTMTPVVSGPLGGVSGGAIIVASLHLPACWVLLRGG